MTDRTLRTWRAPGGLASILFGLVLAVAARPAPARADAAALTVSIGDGLDGDAVKSRLSAELKTPLAMRADDGACDLPCLSITVDGGDATVAYTPLRGAPRARTLALGGDPAQWPVVIALLASNLVRDEAADVLAMLPEPPPSEQAEPVLGDELPGVPVAPEVEVTTVIPAPDSAYGHAPPSSVAVTARAAPRAADPHRPWRPIGFGFVPGLSTDFTQIGRVQHFLSLDLVAGVSGGSTGVTVSGVADIERGRVWGVQVAGVASLAWRVSGFQVAGVAAVAGEVDGVQVAGTAAVAETAEGAQVGGVAAVSRGDADLQIAGVASVAKGRASTQIAGVAAAADGAARIQIAGVATAARGDTNIQGAGVATFARGAANIQAAGVATVAHDANLQAAGVAAVAHGTANIQVAGVVNVARRLEGLQIAPINVARRVDGIQIGVINVGSADGFSFGLINIVPGGRADLEVAVDTSRLGTLLFRHGGRRWHNVYGVGGHPVDENGIGSTDTADVWMYGLGFGPSWRIGETVFDLELMGWQINHGKSHYDGVSLLGQLRLSVAYGIGPFKLVAGGALNAHISSDPESPLMLERRTMEPASTREVTVVTWPSAFFGLRI